MGMQKRLEYGFSGYQVPPTPRATRSVRRRSIPRNKPDENNQMCAFDLLATVAGKLLLESDSSNSSADTSNIKETSRKDSINKEDYNVDQGFFVSELVSQPPGCVKEARHAAHGDAYSGPASVITTSDCSVMVDSPEQLADHGGSRKLETQTKTVPINNGEGAVSVRNTANFPVTGNRNGCALVSSDHSVKFPCGSSFPVNREDVKLRTSTRDDDENNTGCSQASTGNKALRPLVCKIDRRIRKSTTSTTKDDEQSNVVDVDDMMMHRKSGYKRQRSLRDYPFKKRRLYGYNLVSNYDDDEDVNRDGICGGSRSRSPGEAFSRDANAFLGPSPSTSPSPSPSPAPECSSLHNTESHVKLKIKSLRIPELFIEIPETATVGSLKRRVMEAVTAILGGGPHVGVLVQGKKIRDDNKTLLQTGISHNDKLDTLSFILEPHSSHDTPQTLTRYGAPLNMVHNDMLPDPAGTNFSNFVESDHDSASSPPDMSQERNGADLRALVPVPSMNAEALQMVPMRKPTKRSESAQRRIRRPFSVSEVEALVQAVEKLGTGRWRDVKLRAFDNAKHRTYVDLKDKWKTLVHTARISPQQRRGEPVPQELLDRVLMAHAYWSQQQAKQQFKQHSEACLLL